MGAMVSDGNATQYAYAWYIDEQPINQSGYLNQNVINQSFSKPGTTVVRVVVSDMKGGLAARNLVIVVDGAEVGNESLVSGTIRSKQGFVQGARVVLEEAPVIEHTVSMGGNVEDSFFTDGLNDPAYFQIDGMKAPQLVVRRGEIHRFYFDSSLAGTTMSFLDTPENTIPRVAINMLSDPRADREKGSDYFRNPEISYNFRSAFSSYLTKDVGTYLDMLNFLYDHNGSITNLTDDNGTTLELNI